MNKKKLNKLVIDYQTSKDERKFEDIYNYFDRRRLSSISKYQSLDYADVQAIFDDTLLRCIRNFKSMNTDFEHFFNRSFKNKIKNLRRDLNTRSNYEIVINQLNNENEKENSFFEDILIKKGEIDKEEDFIIEVDSQRQLINYFLSKIKDPLTTAIVKEVINGGSSGKLSPTAIGNKLGVHHSKVTRSLGKLSKYYDSDRFGDYRDYLCG